MAKSSNMHRQPTNAPLAYFITIRTYGTLLHGDDRGSVDARHNSYLAARVDPDPDRLAHMKQAMRHEPTILAAESAAVVEDAVKEVCKHRGWHLSIVRARTNHVHIVVAAGVTAERAMNDFKAWATRRLREHGFVRPDQTVWVEHGSTPHLWTIEQVEGAINYVKNWQGGPLQKTWEQVERERLEAEKRR